MLRARIIDGKCSNCGYKIVRPYKKNPETEYYAMNIIHSDKTTCGICEKCRSELELPAKLLSFKYVFKKVVEHEDIHKGN